MADTLAGVKCTVQNCKYWNNGYRCSAPSIEVNVDGGGASANRSHETNCHTFAPR